MSFIQSTVCSDFTDTLFFPTGLPANESLSQEILLCLDDDPISLRIVKQLLRTRFRVLTASTLSEASELARAFPVRYFVCDYHLGNELTGARALLSLYETPFFDPANAILITAKPSAEISHETIKAGFSRIFAKPLRSGFRNYCLNM